MYIDTSILMYITKQLLQNILIKSLYYNLYITLFF